MSPENARIFLVEDKEEDCLYARQALERAGHEVIVEATSLQEALNLISELEEKGINVAVVDGNLTPGDVSGEDGTRIAQEIREKTSRIAIIAFSKSPRSYGDFYVSKRDTTEGAKDLGKVVTNIIHFND